MRSHKNIISMARARCGSHACVTSLKEMGSIVDDLIGKIAELKAANQRLQNEIKTAHDYISECQASDFNAGKDPT